MKLYDWVKRLGQWHLHRQNDSECLCGQAMLGNDYTRLIPEDKRVPCTACFKKLRRLYEESDS